MRIPRTLSLAACFLLISTGINAQGEHSEGDYREDVSTLDGIMHALYEVISGDKGVARDWDRFNYLFFEDAQLTPSGPDQKGMVTANYMSPQQYVEQAGAWLEENGFFETEISREELHFGSLCHVWSTYESRNREDEPEPYSRGINSIQLLNDGARWWIVNIYWTAERDDLPIPEKFLPED